MLAIEEAVATRATVPRIRVFVAAYNMYSSRNNNNRHDNNEELLKYAISNVSNTDIRLRPISITVPKATIRGDSNSSQPQVTILIMGMMMVMTMMMMMIMMIMMMMMTMTAAIC